MALDHLVLLSFFSSFPALIPPLYFEGYQFIHALVIASYHLDTLKLFYLWILFTMASTFNDLYHLGFKHSCFFDETGGERLPYWLYL